MQALQLREQHCGVDAAGQEHAVRNIGPHVLAHDLREQRFPFLGGLLMGSLARFDVACAPVRQVLDVQVRIDA